MEHDNQDCDTGTGVDQNKARPDLQDTQGQTLPKRAGPSMEQDNQDCGVRTGSGQGQDTGGNPPGQVRIRNPLNCPLGSSPQVAV